MESVTFWMNQLKESQHEQAAQELWNRYLSDLLSLARRKMGRSGVGVADEEDVAAMAFMNLISGVRDDRFARLQDRTDLWQVLVMLTDRRVTDLRRRAGAERHGGKMQGHELPADLSAHEPSAEMALQLAEEYQQRLAQLGDDTLRQIAILKLQGYQNEEIRARLDTSLSSVERKLQLIRRIWK
jgi:RNA polymerase sigma factor (sigma-70 family)